MDVPTIRCIFALHVAAPLSSATSTTLKYNRGYSRKIYNFKLGNPYVPVDMNLNVSIQVSITSACC